MKKSKYYLAMFMLLGFMSCDDGESEMNTSDQNITTFKGTQSPGDVWDWTINHDEKTFTTIWDYGTFDDETDDLTISGSFEVLGSGYMKCTINDVAPNSAEVPEDGSAYFYAMHIPDMAMIVKPEGSIKGDLIACVAAGECADIPGDYNYIMTAPGKGSDYDPTQDEAYGVATFLPEENGTFGIHGDKYSLDCINEGICTVDGGITGLPAAECIENGAMTISSDGGDTQIEGQFTAAGVMMMDMGKGNGGVLAFEQSESYTIATLSNEEFVGFAYFPSAEEEDEKIIPVGLSFGNSGENEVIATAAEMININTGELSSDLVTLTIDNVTKGLATGFIKYDDLTNANLAGTILESGGKKMLLISTTNDSGKSFILVLVNK